MSLPQLLTHLSSSASVTAAVARLSHAVSIPSVSSSTKHGPQIVEMAEYLIKLLKDLKVHVETRQPQYKQTDTDRIHEKLPPVILARTGEDKNKKTVLVYGHYDVQPAQKSDGWDTDPFTLVNKNGVLLGRGSTDDKGPVLGWISTLIAHKELNIPLPVNLVMCFEGMEESGSIGLEEIVHEESKSFFKDVDCTCISDNYWLGTEKPCITYGLRGVSDFHVEITGAGRDLHSGLFGGTVHEPMTDLVKVLATLVNPDGKFQVPGVYEMVPTVSEEEEALYTKLDFAMSTFNDSIAGENSILNDPTKTLQNRWRWPSLSIHGVHGAFSEPGFKTVIPAKVTGKFSIRTVANIDPYKLTELVTKYVTDQFAKLGSKNKLRCWCGDPGKPWVADINHWNYRAGHRAIERVWGCAPQYTREGGSIPITLTFEECLGRNVILLPMGRCDDGAHSTNEKLDLQNYIEGTKVLCAYLHEVASGDC